MHSSIHVYSPLFTAVCTEEGEREEESVAYPSSLTFHSTIVGPVERSCRWVWELCKLGEQTNVLWLLNSTIVFNVVYTCILYTFNTGIYNGWSLLDTSNFFGDCYKICLVTMLQKISRYDWIMGNTSMNYISIDYRINYWPNVINYHFEGSTKMWILTPRWIM